MPPASAGTRHIAQYRFSKADFIALSKAMSRRKLRTRLTLLGIWLGLVLLLMAAISTDVKQFASALGELVTFHNVPWQMYAFILAGAAFVMFSDKLSPLRARRLYRLIEAAEQDTTIELNETGIEIVRSGYYARMEWRLIARFIVSEAHMFLATNHIQAVIVPRRAFASDADFDAALQFAAIKAGNRPSPQ
jgi:hypothetical protein